MYGGSGWFCGGFYSREFPVAVEVAVVTSHTSLARMLSLESFLFFFTRHMLHVVDEVGSSSLAVAVSLVRQPQTLSATSPVLGFPFFCCVFGELYNTLFFFQTVVIFAMVSLAPLLSQ